MKDKILEIMANVMENAIFAEVEEVTYINDIESIPGKDYIYRIDITGDPKGYVAMVLGKDAAINFSVDLLGLEEEPDEEIINDAMGELLNIITGNIVGYLYPDKGDKYHLSKPFSISEEDLKDMFEKGEKLFLLVNDYIIGIFYKFDSIS